MLTRINKQSFPLSSRKTTNPIKWCVYKQRRSFAHIAPLSRILHKLDEMYVCVAATTIHFKVCHLDDFDFVFKIRKYLSVFYCGIWLADCRLFCFFFLSFSRSLVSFLFVTERSFEFKEIFKLDLSFFFLQKLCKTNVGRKELLNDIQTKCKAIKLMPCVIVTSEYW